MRISVVIPAYNAEATVAETLASVLEQTLPPNEIVLVDDGSTDRTAYIASQMSSSLRIERQSSRGAAAALNAGMKLTVGDHLAFVDADDIWERDKLATQAALLEERPDLDGVGGLMRTFLCPSNDADTNKRYRIVDNPEPSWLLGALLLRRRCFEACGSFDENLTVGYSIDWYDRARAVGLVFAMQPSVVFHRRIHPGSLGHRSPRGDRSMVQVARFAIERRRNRRLMK
jgi:glycosyltransferase involved in cell wall biosynthesis